MAISEDLVGWWEFIDKWLLNIITLVITKKVQKSLNLPQSALQNIKVHRGTSSNAGIWI